MQIRFYRKSKLYHGIGSANMHALSSDLCITMKISRYGTDCSIPVVVSVLKIQTVYCLGVKCFL